MRTIAAQLGRNPSTINRELRRNSAPGGGYLASSAHAMVYHRASRPKPAKMAVNLALRAAVEKDLEKKYSPEQTAGRLRLEFPNDLPDAGVTGDDLPVAVCPVAGALRRDLAVCLRTGRALRHPSRAPGQREPHPEHDQRQ